MPSVLGPPEGYVYSQFPSLDATLVGPVRPAPHIAVTRQRRRELGTATRTVDKIVHTKLRREEGGEGSRGGGGGSGDDDDLDGYDGDESGETASSWEKRTSMMASMKDRNIRVIRMLSLLQALFRRRKLRQSFLRIRSSALKIQRFRRRLLRSRYERQQQSRRDAGRRTKAVTAIQALVRSFIQVHKLRRALRACVTVQRQWRGKRCRIEYKKVCLGLIRLQASCRGRCCRATQLLSRRALAKQIKEQLLLLWWLDRTSIKYRAKVWYGLAGAGRDHLSLGVMLVEHNRLLESLGLFEEEDVTKNVCHISRDFPLLKNMFLVSRSRIIEAAKAQVPVQGSLLTRSALSAIEVAREREMAERQEMYTILKQNIRQPILDALYVRFPNIGAKKRKRTLVNSVWCHGHTLDLANASADAVLAAWPEINRDAVDRQMNPLRREAVRKACADAALVVLRASMKSKQQLRLKQKEVVPLK